ncbi:hypothetical protein [Streptomyces kaniharaensis]|nr:hypothetical protein [Streptomyces kaniharaensis]
MLMEIAAPDRSGLPLGAVVGPISLAQVALTTQGVGGHDLRDR